MSTDADRPDIKLKSNPPKPDPPQMQGYFIPMSEVQGGTNLDPRIMWQHFKRFRFSILIIVLIPLVVSVIAVSTMNPVYSSDVLLAPVGSEDGQNNLSSLANQFGGLASLAGVTLGGGNDKGHAIAVLKSRRFTEDFIKNENLMPILFRDKWDVDQNRWKSDEQDKTPTIADAYKLFNENIRFLNEDPSVGLVTLRIEWTDRTLAAEWANSLVDRLNDYLRDRDIAEAQRSIEFLNRALEKNSIVELRQGIFSLLEQQIEKIMIANVRQGYAFKVLDPAVVSDEDKYVRPKKLVIVIAATALGLFFALVIVMLRVGWESLPPREQ